MYAETPRVAPLLRALERFTLIPPIESRELPRSRQLQNTVFLLQEVAHYPLRFRFKGALLPYSEGLERVVRDYRRQREFVDNVITPEMSEDERVALARFEDIAEPPADFAGGRERWLQLLSAFVFIAFNPLYTNGRKQHRRRDFRRFFGRVFNDDEIGLVAERVENEIEPALRGAA
jgi:hypothetical protein